MFRGRGLGVGFGVGERSFLGGSFRLRFWLVESIGGTVYIRFDLGDSL